ncbi:DUF3099 domain-containing protein [Lacisediminihabitans changchengi]|nr:DUF3099 domain-containing protein [Lacisediminihabitans changchengi]
MQSITSIPRSPQDDRRSRVIQYSIAMAIRMVCIVLCLFVRGWWLLLPAIGAVVLPYIAVVLANATTQRGSAPVLRPGGIVRVAPIIPTPADAPPAGHDESHR